MRRRDRQNEIIVALVVAIAMGFALVFSIVLSLDDQSDEENPQTQVANATRPTVATAFAPSPGPSEAPTEVPTEAPLEASEVAQKPSDTPKASDTRQPPSATPSPTATPSASHTPSPSNTRTPTDTPSLTPSNTRTPTDTPSRTPSNTHTPTDTPSRTSSPTRTSNVAGVSSPTQSRAVFTSTTVPLVQRTSAPAVAAVSSPSPTPTACVPRSDWEIYTVDIGDTFFSIARSYDLSVDQLAAANCIANPARILAGQPLRVPEGGFSRADAAIEHCNSPDAILTAPRAGDRLAGFVTLQGVARGGDFRRYILDWRPDNPGVDFRSFAEEFSTVPEVGDLGRFNTDAFDPGLYWFRLRVLETNDFIIGECSIRVRFR